MTVMLDALLFDLMGTVVYDPYREALEAAAGMELGAAFRLRDPDCWPAFERGAIDEAEFARRFFADGDSSQTLDMAAFHRVRQEGYHLLPGMGELLDGLQGRVDCYIASNYPVWIEQLQRQFGLDRLFRKVYASCYLGLRKPDPAFFHAILTDLALEPQCCLFVDDRPENCEAAAAMGIEVHLFDGALGLNRRLAEVGVLPA
jgi:HAD superfamily hydrolase (TIGR01509 family)